METKLDDIIKQQLHCMADYCVDEDNHCKICEDAFRRGYEMAMGIKKHYDCNHDCDAIYEAREAGYKQAKAEQDKYAWHDLRKDPKDLPPDSTKVHDIDLKLYMNGGLIISASGRWHNDYKEFAVDGFNVATTYALPLEFHDSMKTKKSKCYPFYVIAWRYMEPIETRTNEEYLAIEDTPDGETTDYILNENQIRDFCDDAIKSGKLPSDEDIHACVRKYAVGRDVIGEAKKIKMYCEDQVGPGEHAIHLCRLSCKFMSDDCKCVLKFPYKWRLDEIEDSDE